MRRGIFLSKLGVLQSKWRREMSYGRRENQNLIPLHHIGTMSYRCEPDSLQLWCLYSDSLACSDSQELSTMVSFSLYHRPWGIRKQLLDRVEQPITYFDPSKNGKTNIPSKLAFWTCRLISFNLLKRLYYHSRTAHPVMRIVSSFVMRQIVILLRGSFFLYIQKPQPVFYHPCLRVQRHHYQP